MRTLVDIPDDDLKLLKLVTQKLGLSRAEFVRQAIAAHLAPHRRKMSHAAFGLWAV
jgi:metal-responsive CopG/Arc/MetJ family transcriptional regulator